MLPYKVSSDKDSRAAEAQEHLRMPLAVRCISKGAFCFEEPPFDCSHLTRLLNCWRSAPPVVFKRRSNFSPLYSSRGDLSRQASNIQASKIGSWRAQMPVLYILRVGVRRMQVLFNFCVVVFFFVFFFPSVSNILGFIFWNKIPKKFKHKFQISKWGIIFEPTGIAETLRYTLWHLN